MKTSVLRELTKQEALDHSVALYKREAILQLKRASKELKNTAELKKNKKSIARLLTVLKEQNLKEQREVVL